MKDRADISKVLDTLAAEGRSFKELAQLSGFDPFTFYQGGELSNLDLSGEDLTGLNFDRSDLRGSKLDSVKYDIGAFNGAILDEKYESKKDEFEFSIEDIHRAKRYGLHFYARFRESSLQAAIYHTGLTYGSFADVASINLQTLRKARRSGIVAAETAISICDALLRNKIYVDGLLGDASSLRQPFISILDLSNKGIFVKVNRSDFIDVFNDNIWAEAAGKSFPRPTHRTSFAIRAWMHDNAYLLDDV